MKQIVYTFIMMLFVGVVMAGPLGAEADITANPTSVSSGDIVTFTVTVTKGSDDIAGIISIVKPASYSYYDSSSWEDTLDIRVIDIYGDNIDLVFADEDQTSTFTFYVKAGSVSDYVNADIEWAGGGSESIADICIKVDDESCEGISPPPSDGDMGWIIWVVVGLGAILLISRIGK